MKHKSWTWVILSLVLFFSLACNFLAGGGATTETPPPPPPPPASSSTGDGGSSAGSFTVTIANRAPMAICYVFISPSEDDSWGDDWLGDDEIIATDERRSFDVPSGTYDVMVRDCDGIPMATFWEIAQPTTLDVGKAGTHVVTVENDSSTDVCYVYISPSTSENWGDDWLGQKESIKSGSSRHFFVSPGTYDLLAIDCDGNDLAQETGVEVDSDITWTLSDQ